MPEVYKRLIKVMRKDGLKILRLIVRLVKDAAIAECLLESYNLLQLGSRIWIASGLPKVGHYLYFGIPFH